MSSKTKKPHYSPIFANEPWVDDTGHYACWERNEHKKNVISKPVGRKDWGRKLKKELWDNTTEQSLAEKLDHPAARIYGEIRNGKEPSADNRLKWAQFIRAQIVRTPSFIKYEKTACNIFRIEEKPTHSRVGCIDCEDLTEITGRRWKLLAAHQNDYFIRTDNPVYYTGFLNDPATTIYYPLSPTLCFVATAMNSDWNPKQESLKSKPMEAVQLEKGGGHMLNFYMAQAAYDSLILKQADSGSIAETMFTSNLGTYPQPPFDLHKPQLDEFGEANESIRKIMSLTDNCEYPKYTADDMSLM